MSSQTSPANPNRNRRYRVVQWATGNVGTRSLQRVIEHPAYDLVGLYVHSAEKAGRDAGELCGLAPVGVKATNSIDDIVALRPDCVLYMQQGCNFDDICRLLAAGINIVTTRGEFHNPSRMDPGIRERVEAACRDGNSSIHSTGSSPGFSTEVLPLSLLLMQRRLDRLDINEYADLTSRNSPDLLFNVMGFGQPLGQSSEGRLQHFRESFGPALDTLTTALGLPLDDLQASGGFAAASRTIRIAAGEIAAGTVAAQRTTVTGLRNGQPLVTLTATWYCTTEIDADWDLRPSGWRMEVLGDAPLDVSIRFPVSEADYPAMTPGLTAHPAVNAVAAVCDAAPGIRTGIDLRKIIPQLA